MVIFVLSLKILGSLQGFTDILELSQLELFAKKHPE
jgi:hypothetical protein